MRFGKLTALLLGSLVLAMARAACAEVIINYPSSGGTVNGSVTVTAFVNNAYWSKLWVDGKGIATSGIGNVSFKWNAGAFSNGTHTLKVAAYPYASSTANAAAQISYRGGQQRIRVHRLRHTFLHTSKECFPFERRDLCRRDSLGAGNGSH